MFPLINNSFKIRQDNNPLLGLFELPKNATPPLKSLSLYDFSKMLYYLNEITKKKKKKKTSNNIQCIQLILFLPFFFFTHLSVLFPS